MSESDSKGSRAELLARVLRFTDIMINRLNEASKGKDVEEKDSRPLGNIVLKSLRLWEKALPAGQRDPRLEERLRLVRQQVPEIKGRGD